MFRKTTYLSFILALALTGCNDDFEPGQDFAPDGSISFGTYIGNANSRASVVDASALQSSSDGFGVMAYLTGTDSYDSATKPNYMYNQQVVHGSGSWNYSPLKYWPASADEKISFFAYAPYAGAAASLDASESGVTELPRTDAACDPVIKYEFGSDISKHIDLLYASAKDKTNADRTVNFEFKHALSRVGFKVCGWEDDGSGIDFDDNTSVTINAITLSTVRRGASLNLCSGEWSESVNGGVQAFTLAGDHLQNNIIKPTDGAMQLNTEDGYMMIVPDDFIDDEASKRYCVLVDYTVETIDPNLLSGKLVVRNKVYRYLAPNFQAGKAYTINIHLGMTDNPGSGDNGTDIVGPTPVDPNPDDATTPSTGGKNSYVRFSTTVIDWVNAESHDIPLAPATPGAPEATFTANQLNLHITGSFSYANPDEAPALNTVKLLSMVKEGSTENILKGEQSFAAGSFSIPTSNMKLGKLESDVKYILKLRNANGDIYTTDLTMQFGMMQMTVDIPSAGAAFTMPLKTGSTPTKMAFVWDEEYQSGELSSITTSNNTRTFQTAGLKRIKILSARPNSSTQPQMTEFSFNSYARDYRGLLFSMDTPILKTGQTSFSLAFKECTNLVSISDGLFDNNPDVTDMSNVFESCTSLQSIPVGLFDKTTKVTTFKQAFMYCSGIQSIPAGIFDYTPKVTDFWGTFVECSNITSLPENLFANKTKATSFLNTLAGTSITTVPASTFKNCTSAQNFNSTFSNCESLESIEEGAFDDLVNATLFLNLFSGCTSLKNIPESLFANCVSATTFAMAFGRCSSLETIPEKLFYGCPNITNFGDAFTYCSSLKSIPAGLFRESAIANNFGSVFNCCTSITSIPEGLFDNCPKATVFGHAFHGCTSLTTVPKNLFDNNFNTEIPKYNSAIYLFKDCAAITSEVPELWNRPELKNFTEAYRGCVNAANYADIPLTWK